MYQTSQSEPSSSIMTPFFTPFQDFRASTVTFTPAAGNWAKVRSHGAFDQLCHQQSESQFRGLQMPPVVLSLSRFHGIGDAFFLVVGKSGWKFLRVFIGEWWI